MGTRRDGPRQPRRRCTERKAQGVGCLSWVLRDKEALAQEEVTAWAQDRVSGGTDTEGSEPYSL